MTNKEEKQKSKNGLLLTDTASVRYLEGYPLNHLSLPLLGMPMVVVWKWSSIVTWLSLTKMPSSAFQRWGGEFRPSKEFRGWRKSLVIRYGPFPWSYTLYYPFSSKYTSSSLFIIWHCAVPDIAVPANSTALCICHTPMYCNMPHSEMLLMHFVLARLWIVVDGQNYQRLGGSRPFLLVTLRGFQYFNAIYICIQLVIKYLKCWIS